MALKFQYNKTAMQQLKRQLTIREKALPTLKNKESALRIEVKKVSDKVNELQKGLEEKKKTLEIIEKYWVEFPDIVNIDKVNINIKKIAGVKIPLLEDINFKITDFSIFNENAWFLSGADRLKNLVQLSIEIEIIKKQFEILNYARKKTTQKVNLYEKVQIPAYKEALIKIKRFLEDVENLSKASQKIVKERNRAKEAAL